MVRRRKKKDPKSNRIPFVEEPQESLVPWKGPFYVTPEEPADPRDCDRYPSSPWCGGNPIDWKPIDITPSIVADECNFGVQFEPTFGYIKLPPLQIVARSPGCGDPEKPINPDLPAPPIGSGIENLGLLTLPGDPLVVAFLTSTQYGTGQYFSVTGRTFTSRSFRTTGISSLECEDNPRFTNAKDIIVKGTYQRTGFSDRSWLEYDFSDTFQIDSRINITPFDDEFVWQRTQAHIEGRVWYQRVAPFTVQGTDGTVEGIPRGLVYGGRASDVQEYIKNFGGTSRSKSTTSSSISSTNYKIVAVWYAESCDLVRPPRNIIPYPVFPDDCCMRCCKRSPYEEDNLAEILEKLSQIADTLGVDEFPAVLPNTLIEEEEEGEIQPIEVPNMSKLLEWMILRLDELFGQWELPIEIVDTDPFKEGDQSAIVRLGNVAEALGEIYQYLVETNINTQINTSLALKGLMETGQNKIQGLKTYLTAKGIQEYLGFPVEDSKQKIKISYDPKKETTAEFLQESEQEIVITEFNGEGQTFREALSDLLNAAAIIRSVHWRKMDTKGGTSVASQLIGLVKDLDVSAVASAISDLRGISQQFEEYLNSVEEGFKGTGTIETDIYPRSEIEIKVVGEE